MLTEYTLAALRQARYEILEDGTFYDEIHNFQGVYANAETLEDCREQLREVLEDWIVLGLRMGHSFPTIAGMSLKLVGCKAIGVQPPGGLKVPHV